MTYLGEGEKEGGGGLPRAAQCGGGKKRGRGAEKGKGRKERERDRQTDRQTDRGPGYALWPLQKKNRKPGFFFWLLKNTNMNPKRTTTCLCTNKS